MAKSSKFYVVWVGRNPGVYTSWEETRAQIDGFPDARYKSFPSMAEANSAFKQGAPTPAYMQNKKSTTKKSSSGPIQPNSISVDAACSGNPGLMEYQGVETISKKPIFHLGPFRDGTNNIGEFLAIVHGLALLKKKNREDVIIYTDSVTAIGWVKKKKANTKLEQTPHNKELFELIDRAEAWLKNNTYKTQILKWDTNNWGEIPADFGRK